MKTHFLILTIGLILCPGIAESSPFPPEVSVKPDYCQQDTTRRMNPALRNTPGQQLPNPYEDTLQLQEQRRRKLRDRPQTGEFYQSPLPNPNRRSTDPIPNNPQDLNDAYPDTTRTNDPIEPNQPDRNTPIADPNFQDRRW